MNEMLTLPLFVILLLFTAVLSSIITTIMPMLPVYWNAFKDSIKRKFTRKPKTNVYCDDLQEQVNELASRLVTREKHLKGNVRRYVREYLEELKTK